MENVPLREYMDRRFLDHQKHVDQQFSNLQSGVDSLKEDIRANRVHHHSGYVAWAALIPIVLSVVGLILLYG